MAIAGSNKEMGYNGKYGQTITRNHEMDALRMTQQHVIDDTALALGCNMRDQQSAPSLLHSDA